MQAQDKRPFAFYMALFKDDEMLRFARCPHVFKPRSDESIFERASIRDHVYGDEVGG